MADSNTTSIATVVTHDCNGSKGFWGQLSLPRAEEEGDITAAFNEMVQQVEDRFNLLNVNTPIVECIVDGAIILDCAHGSLFEVDLTEDINSITFKNCDAPGQDVQVNFRGTTVDPITGLRFVSGWPSDVVCSICGTAIEPTSVPIGNTFSQGFETNRFGFPVSQSSAKQPGGDTDFDCVETCLNHSSMIGYPFESKIRRCVDVCEKQPGGGVNGSGDGDGGIPAGNGEGGLDPCETINALNVQVETELDCNETTPLIKLRACGGDGNYTWTVAGGGGGTPEVTKSGGWDQVITISPPVTDSSVGGTAYRRVVCISGCGHVSGSTHSSTAQDALYGCDGIFISCSGIGSGVRTVVFADLGCNCSDHLGHSMLAGNACAAAVTCAATCPAGDSCQCAQDVGAVIDDRTQQMIDDGCVPCSVSMDGVTITVTDGEGVSVVTVIST